MVVRNSVTFVPWQQRKQVCADLKAIYSAATESEAEIGCKSLCFPTGLIIFYPKKIIDL